MSIYKTANRIFDIWRRTIYQKLNDIQNICNTALYCTSYPFLTKRMPNWGFVCTLWLFMNMWGKIGSITLRPKAVERIRPINSPNRTPQAEPGFTLLINIGRRCFSISSTVSKSFGNMYKYNHTKFTHLVNKSLTMRSCRCWDFVPSNLLTAVDSCSFRFCTSSTCLRQKGFGITGFCNGGWHEQLIYEFTIYNYLVKNILFSNFPTKY